MAKYALQGDVNEKWRKQHARLLLTLSGQSKHDAALQ